jgi:hypothetical protein
MSGYTTFRLVWCIIVAVPIVVATVRFHLRYAREQREIQERRDRVRRYRQQARATRFYW